MITFYFMRLLSSIISSVTAPSKSTTVDRLGMILAFYMSFDRFLLAVESRDLSQADKNIIRVSSFSILQNFNV